MYGDEEEYVDEGNEDIGDDYVDDQEAVEYEDDAEEDEVEYVDERPSVFHRIRKVT